MTRLLWILWIVLSIAGLAYFGFAVNAELHPSKKMLLPGETTHGHYQIELACHECHTKFMGVKQDACDRCHAAELKAEKDTHPASKFRDPTNAERLEQLDAMKCITCHREHVPDRTGSMGLTLPKDYCFHCHDDVAEQRPSHEGMSHDTCATAGCHNYHDNKALYENFLFKNCDQPDVLEEAKVVLRNLGERWAKKAKRRVAKEDDTAEPESLQLDRLEADAPSDLLLKDIVHDWASTAHAAAGVNCRSCHDVVSNDKKITQWENKIGIEACQKCHAKESESFVAGRHGMRLAVGLSAMTPEMARHPMHQDAAHKQLNCSACHPAHNYDTAYAAVDACMSCHDDEHTKNYKKSAHYTLWKEEQSSSEDAKAAPDKRGTGVSCATCHMPRVADGDDVYVQHNQNYNLRPNEKMIRGVCMSCHGLEFSLNSLADSLLIEQCFHGQPSVEIDSAQMAKRWFESKQRRERKTE